MTQKQDRSRPSVLVAIDVLKLKNDVLIEVPGKRRRQGLRILNTQADHDRLIKTLGKTGDGVHRPNRKLSTQAV